TLDLAILWRLHRVQPGRLNTMKSASGGHFCFAKTGHYRFAATTFLRIIYLMLNNQFTSACQDKPPNLSES
ncbi:hypothetical protein, partial [Cupriavidus oxalaticus]|uniref:hypothetical protein n=1 Tax=Cupriavidus oxalaticus TaxID=96344 RepID=UPI00317099E5